MTTQALVPTLEFTSSFTSEQLTALEQPLSVQFIKERKGPGGKLLKYITTKTAIETANQIFGVGKWGYRVLSRGREAVGEQTFYTADIELYVMGCPFPFPGEGEGVPQANTADQHAKARKEAVSDALKRALRHYGDQFGLALYDEESLIEDADGNLARAKDVHPGNNNQQSRHIVDSQPQASQKAATSQMSHHPSNGSKAMPASPGQANEPTKRETRQDIVDAFLVGKEQGFWRDKGGFYTVASAVTGKPINEKNVNDLSDETLVEMLKQPA